MASEVKPGQWIVQRTGAYLVDEVAVVKGIAYIGTKDGVLVLPAGAPVMAGDS